MLPNENRNPENQHPAPIPSGLYTREDPRFASQLKRIEGAKQRKDQKDLEAISPILPELTQSHSDNFAHGKARRWEIPYEELKLEQKLGQGAFGEVFSGTFRKSKVAVKLYNFRGKLPSEQAEMLLKEADVMKELRSEYLVSFRGICIDPRYHFGLVMEFCEGGTLRARLDKTNEEIDPIEQLRWAMQISYGLYQLHSVRIVHQDLKGENILLDDRGHAKVADFGLSIVKSYSASPSQTGINRNGAGTIPWMAPELHEDKSNSKETDVYSLGVVLYEIVSRKIPYAGLLVGQMISKTVTGRRDPLPDPCPAVFRLMITACLNLEANQRPTAEQVGDQFAAALKSVESITSPVMLDLKPQAAGLNEEMKKLLEEVKKLKREKMEYEQRQAEWEKITAEHAQVKAELERKLNIKQRETELKKNSSTPKQEASALSQSRFTITPAPKSAFTPLDHGIQPVDAKALEPLLRSAAEGEQEKAPEPLTKKEKEESFSKLSTMGILRNEDTPFAEETLNDKAYFNKSGATLLGFRDRSKTIDDMVKDVKTRDKISIEKKDESPNLQVFKAQLQREHKEPGMGDISEIKFYLETFLGSESATEKDKVKAYERIQFFLYTINGESDKTACEMLLEIPRFLKDPTVQSHLLTAYYKFDTDPVLDSMAKNVQEKQQPATESTDICKNPCLIC